MSNYVVWIDTDHAQLYELRADHDEKHSVHRHEIRHHNGAEKEHNHHKDGAKFFHEIAEKLGTAHQILLLGPGLAKKHFQAHLHTHHHADLEKKVVGMETCDHPSEGQIIAMAKKFFAAHLRFE